MNAISQLARILCVVTLASSAHLAWAQADLRDPRDNEAMDDYRNEVRGLTEPAAQETVKEDTQDAVAETVENRTTTVAPAAGFAARVNNSMADFLPLFQGAVNGVSTSDDEKSVTLRFNPIRWPHAEIGVAGVVAEPAVFDKLLDGVAEGARAAQEDAIRQKLDDFDNVTLTASVNLLWGSGSFGDSRLSTYWGRDPKRYEALLDEIILGAMDAESRDAARKIATGKIQPLVGKFVEKFHDKVKKGSPPPSCDKTIAAESVFWGQTFACVKDVLSAGDAADLLLAMKEEAVAVGDFQAAIVASRVIDLLPALVDNQPQLVVDVSSQRTDQLAGPEAFVASLSFEHGWNNLNSVIRKYRKANGELSAYQAFEELAAKGDEILTERRAVLSLTYRRIGLYAFDYPYVEHVTDPGTGAVSDFPRLVSLRLPASSELTGSFQYGMLLGKPPKDPTAPRPRLDVSADYLNVSDDDAREDRFTGTITYTHPISDTVSLPFSLTYANKTEFVGDPDKQWGAHIGLSYKLHRPHGGS